VLQSILIVGAGFAGAVFARQLAEAGYRCQVIDRRPHIAGNAFDEVGADGIRIHRYGPHLFHTNNKSVVDWLSRFTEFVPYEHKVEALLGDGRCLPMPINRRTLEGLFKVDLPDAEAAQAFLRTLAVPIEAPANAAEHLLSQIGPDLTDLFFRPYTKKMWEMDLEEMDASVVKRIPLRFDDEDRYFPNDQYQFMFRGGYTKAFERILDHPLIRVETGKEFDKAMLREFDHCFNSMPIDEYFGYEYGPLPYRSIRFHHREVPSDHGVGYATTINFTDAGPLTRETDWSRIPDHVVRQTGLKTLTAEEPCDYRDNNMERYYPVKTSDGRYQAVYEKYKALAEQVGECSFIGRCGTYQYLDMHQVINQSLMHVDKWIEARK
jgi:UDP-galactopyranose mutase